MDSLWLRLQCSECLVIDGGMWAQIHLYKIIIYDAKATFNSLPYVKRKMGETSKSFCNLMWLKTNVRLLLWHYGLLFQTVTQVRCPETMQRWLRYTKVTEGTCVRAVQVPTLITFTHTSYHNKSNSDRYSLQSVNRKLFESRVSEQKLIFLWKRLGSLLPWFIENILYFK